jgi:ribonucleoside-triphosphate reductase
MNNLPSLYQEFIAKSKYARWIDEENRRESWPETVARYFDFFENHLAKKCNFILTKEERTELENAVLNLEAMPSMRALMTAGEALELHNVAGYNCAYVAVDNIKVFDEILYVLMCGTGVGFSVERQYVEKLPTIAEEFAMSETVVVVKDSKVGWAKAYRELISLLVGGQIPKWDVSKVRPAGARLKTFGGRASGPGPLINLFQFTVDTFTRAAGRKLTSIECHDLVCKIAEIVVVGGVRRSALISLSNLTDERMRDAKSGAWWNDNSQRALANNSVAYKEKPEIGIFMEEWLSLYKSKSGERGIFNRAAAKKTVEKLGDRRDPNHEWGCNPCSEILLRNKQFCNLSEVIIRPNYSWNHTGDTH